MVQRVGVQRPRQRMQCCLDSAILPSPAHPRCTDTSTGRAPAHFSQRAAPIPFGGGVPTPRIL
eukprot:2265896-Prymnesium_polylepis.1